MWADDFNISSLFQESYFMVIVAMFLWMIKYELPIEYLCDIDAHYFNIKVCSYKSLHNYYL